MAVRRGLYIRRVLAQNVRRLRKARKMNQEEIADAAAMNQSQISKIEGAKLNIKLDKVQALATALGVRFADLFDETKR